MKYLGDLTEDQVIDFKFSTHQANGTPITLAGTPAVAVYVENSTTEITSGVTLTVDFDGRTGCHHVRIDTSASASYAVAKDYQIVITAGTVDGVSVVGAVLAIFSIENRFIEADVTKIGGNAQSATDLKDFADTGYDPATHEVTGLHEDVVAEIQQDLALETTAQSIKAKTDNLPADPADASDIATAFSTVNTTLATIAAYVDTEIAAIKLIVDHLGTAIELDGSVYRFTTNALEQAPTGGGGAFSAAQLAQLAGLGRIVGVGNSHGRKIELTVGSTYLTSQGTALELNNAAGSWAITDGDTITLHLSRTVNGTETEIECSGTIIEDSGSAQQVDIDIDTDDSDLLTEGEWEAQLWRVRSDKPKHLETFRCIVEGDGR